MLPTWPQCIAALKRLCRSKTKRLHEGSMRQCRRILLNPSCSDHQGLFFPPSAGIQKQFLLSLSRSLTRARALSLVDTKASLSLALSFRVPFSPPECLSLSLRHQTPPSPLPSAFPCPSTRNPRDPTALQLFWLSHAQVQLQRAPLPRLPSICQLCIPGALFQSAEFGHQAIPCSAWPPRPPPT